MSEPRENMPPATEAVDASLHDLDLRSTEDVASALLVSQQGALSAVERAQSELVAAIDAAAARLSGGNGRLVYAGAGASGRLAVQDGAELWPTFGWPASRLVLAMAGGARALLESVEGVEDDADAARSEVMAEGVGADDVVLALAASGSSAWTCEWLSSSRKAGALTIGMASNAPSPLLTAADYPVHLASGAEVLAGSTRMAAGTAQKVALNVFSTALMVRLNRTFGNLMVDMAAANRKLDTRRVRMLQTVLPDVDDVRAQAAIDTAEGWVKLAVLIARGQSREAAIALLKKHDGSLRQAMRGLEVNP